jgi:TraE protein
MTKTARLVQNASVRDIKGENDTIRLWEGYRDQAILWRALSILQIPATAMCAALSFYLWTTHKTIVNVPPKPQPGQYLAEEIPDSEFIDVATEFVNLISSYQPAVASRQFHRAEEMIVEPYLAKFKSEILTHELKTIQATSRTQLYFINPVETRIERNGDDVTVFYSGERQKFVAGKQIDPVKSMYRITLTTVPRNPLNPYGIVVKNAFLENVN